MFKLLLVINITFTMPRCYMVKKHNYYKNQMSIRDSWDEAASNSEAPESPIEACTAPPCYTPLTNRSEYNQEISTINSNQISYSPTIYNDDTPTFRTRSVEETEAAHDLLSLSQSLPPLPAPGAVTISVPSNETSCIQNLRSPSPDDFSYSIQPNLSSVQVPVTMPSYHPSIVYVVQMPTIPTPPTSECSSDTENQLHQKNILRQDVPIVNDSSQILILPLSPAPEALEEGLTEINNEVNVNSDIIQVSSVPTTVIVSPPVSKVPVRQQSVIKSIGKLPDKRTRRTGSSRSSRINKNKDNNNDSATTNHNTETSCDDPEDNRMVLYSAVEEPYNLSISAPSPPSIPSETSEPEERVSSSKPSPRYVCIECGKQYATSSNLSRHKQTHRSLDSHSAKKCMTCGKAYVSMPALAMHLLTHKLAHVCGVCGKQFSRPWLLQGHLRSHTGEKPYSCAQCGKAFADRSNLRAHMQTHSADKNFRCPKCKKTFALKSYLNKHQESACWDFGRGRNNSTGTEVNVDDSVDDSMDEIIVDD